MAPGRERLLISMRASIILARQFKRFRKKFHFSQTELADLLGRSRDFVSDVENVKYERIRPSTHRLFLMLKDRHETERRNQRGLRRRNPSGESWGESSPSRMERQRDVHTAAGAGREQQDVAALPVHEDRRQ